MALQEEISDFGNALVASAGALIILAWLWTRLSWVAALAFLVCFLGVIGSVAGLKLIAFDLRAPVGETSILGLSQGAPSGHTAFAAIVYGSLALILWALDRRPRAMAAAVLCLAVVAAVAITRVTLARHTIGDVIAGLIVAGIGVGLFAKALTSLAGDRSISAMAPFGAVAVVTVALLASGLRFTAMAPL